MHRDKNFSRHIYGVLLLIYGPLHCDYMYQLLNVKSSPESKKTDEKLLCRKINIKQSFDSWKFHVNSDFVYITMKNSPAFVKKLKAVCEMIKPW